VKVWVVGARGMLGQAVVAQLRRRDIDVTSSDLDLDISKAAEVGEFARAHAFSHVINCAAYTRVDAAETDAAAAFAANADGPLHLATAAARTGACLVHFSTDYVFDGTASTPYPETAPGAALGVYGRSKLAGEQHVLAAGLPRWFVLRTSWLFGEGGSNFVATMLGLFREREELRVVADQHGRPTYTGDLAAAGLDLALSGHASGIYHFANQPPTTWHGFASTIAQQARELGFPVRTRTIHAIATADTPRPAPRPAYSVLDTTKIEATLGRALRPWTAALHDYLAHQRNTMNPNS
jgi:dTDP-4-dehydrorhamnose reductase